MKLWAMQTERLAEGKAARLLEPLPLSVRERILSASEEMRQQSLWAYSLLAFALRESQGMVLPEIGWSETGKPYFPGYPKLFFNISHTKGAVLVGVSTQEIGVDIEQDRPPPSRVCELLQPGERPFFSEWVRWEACAKCIGSGVLPVLRRRELPADIIYRQIETFPGYWAGAAALGSVSEPVIRCVESSELLDES